MCKTDEFYTIRAQDIDCGEEEVVIPETIGQLVWTSSDGSHESGRGI